MDLFVAARAADVAGIHITTFGRAGTVAFFNASGRGHANRETHELGARHIDSSAGWQTYPETQHNTNPVNNAQAHGDTDARANANADTNSNPSSNADADSRAANLQPRLCHRDGERGVDQPDR